ncbi:uncharacterized protein H6S33_000607 [Morchella sextelata]|uniref:uncharacterized protein n=1 Tax=Morchella sextelata TaxID=1174677 RepID=UPI001D055915|nr:uncharacterized protein H6S33_000607 [Morchella sextelata]KAH0614971.1 hypothetical protein H6S33_000607 [Morchella sextelata]
MENNPESMVEAVSPWYPTCVQFRDSRASSSREEIRTHKGPLSALDIYPQCITCLRLLCPQKSTAAYIEFHALFVRACEYNTGKVGGPSTANGLVVQGVPLKNYFSEPITEYHSFICLLLIMHDSRYHSKTPNEEKYRSEVFIFKFCYRYF